MCDDSAFTSLRAFTRAKRSNVNGLESEPSLVLCEQHFGARADLSRLARRITRHVPSLHLFQLGEPLFNARFGILGEFLAVSHSKIQLNPKNALFFGL